MANKIQIRRDTAANWTSSNPTLSQGEQGYETDTGKLKIGDGSTAWTSLGYSFISYTDSDVDTHLNTSTAASGEVLSWTGSDYDWIASGGGSPDLFADNDVSATAPTASGDNSVAIGDDAQATSTNSIAIGSTYNGSGARATTGAGAVAIGGSRATGAEAFAANIGSNSSSGAQGTSSIAMGFGANASATEAVSIGKNSAASGSNSLALGQNSTASATNSVAIGENSLASSADSFAIGYNTDATATNASAFGYNAQAAGGSSVALGNSRAGGTDSIAAAIGNNTSSYGATGQSGVALGYRARATALYSASLGGYQNTSSGTYAITAGSQNTASATRTISIGGHFNTASGDYAATLGGIGNIASGDYSRAGGYFANTQNIYGKDAYASQKFSTGGDQQRASLVLFCDTTDATAEALRSNTSAAGTTNQVILPNNSAYFFSGTCVARESAADGTDMGAWEFKGCIRREANAGTTTLVSSTIDEFSAPTGWSVALSADTTNGGLKVEVTGAASTNIRWVATVNTSEVTYA